MNRNAPHRFISRGGLPLFRLAGAAALLTARSQPGPAAPNLPNYAGISLRGVLHELQDSIPGVTAEHSQLLSSSCDFVPRLLLEQTDGSYAWDLATMYMRIRSDDERLPREIQKRQDITKELLD